MKIKMHKSLFWVVFALVMCLCQQFVLATEEQSDEPVILYKEYVVVLDSGHDSEHTGARANGIKEEEINLEIAKACKAELEKYNNITVYMTHDGLTCPYPGTEANECNKSRCEYAASVEADLFISFHANYNTSRSRNGFEIIYPNTHYKEEFNVTGEVLSNFIVEELKTTGMKFREIWTRNSTEYKKNDENYYPDGTRADYYNVIRNCKYNDILSVIIEHGYISNWSDVKNYLSSEKVLKEMGEADARGIIKYLASVELNDRNDIVKDFLRNKINGAKDFFSVFANWF